MKRKVRIYKDPNGNGGYINKTAQWLRKAQDGAQVGMTPVTAGIMQQMQSMTPQQMEQQSAQGQEEDVVLQETTQMISRGMDKEDIKAQLLAKYGNYEEGTPEYADAEAQIDQYLETVYDQLGENAREETNENLGMEDIDEYQAVEEVPENEPNYYYDLAEEDSADSDIEEDYSFGNLKYGGIPNKRSFINKTIRGLKKAQQGDQVEGENVANVRGTEDNPTGTTGNKNMFIAGVKGQAQDHFLKKQAEEMYNNQFGQGMPQPQADMDYAQFGGMRMRRANRKLFGTPFTPPGVTSSKYSFGPLGGVRSAEVQFNPLMMASMASMFPMMSFPGMGGFSSYSYMTPKKKYTTGRLVTEKISNAVNKESIKDVAKATESDAANNAVGPCTEAEVKDPNNKRCYDPMYAGQGPLAPNQSSVQGDPNAGGTGSGPTPGGTSNTGPFEVNGARQAMELKNKKDKWGRSPNDKWYGFDPTSKIYVQGPNKGKTSSEVKAAEKAKIEAEQSTLRKNIEQILPTSLKYDPTGKIPKEAVDWAQERVTQKKPYGMDEKKWKEYQKLYANKKQAGGIINRPQQDQFGNLQKFIYGGDEMDQIFLEDLYQPPINQSDLDYSDSKDVTDAYFMHGGLHKAYDGYSMQGFNPSMFGNYGDFGTTGYNYGFRGTPMYGLGSYGTGSLGAGARLIGSLASGRRRGYMPNMNPMQYAATAAGITKSGMLPTGISYTKEKSKGLLGNLGLKYDRNMTINYATPEQIKAGVTNANLSTKPTTPAINVNDKSKTTNEFGLNKKLNFPDDNNRFKLSDARINAADRRSNRQENRMMNRDLRTGDILKFTGPDMSNMQDMEMPANTIDSYKAGTDPKLGFAFGGYIPDYMSYDDYIPMADQGINFSSISYNPNSIVQPGGIGQGKTGPCTEEEVKDPNSPCYDPIYAGQGPRSKDQSQETASLTYKEVKEPMSAERAANRLGLGIDFSNILADEKDALNEYKYKKIPGMTEFAMGEKFAAGEPLNRGMWGRGGKEGDPQSFKGVIKKGGAIKSKKSNASGHKIDMNDFQSLLKLAGLI